MVHGADVNHLLARARSRRRGLRCERVPARPRRRCMGGATPEELAALAALAAAQLPLSVGRRRERQEE